MAESPESYSKENFYTNPTVSPPSLTELSGLAKRLNFTLSDDELNQCHALMSETVKAFTRLDHLVEPVLPVKYPRTPGYRPSAEENTFNAWYWKSAIKGAETGKLAGKKVAMKDNIMVAGVPMMNGCRGLEGTVPEVDATVVTRLLDSGATILGKATCESMGYSGCSFNAGYGPVMNFHDKTRSAGGSSSGNAVLIMTDEVDMAVGADQGGSIRTPSCWTGCVGLKPTWGLVPYTGAMSMEPTLDHLGPMARTVHDCALMLEVLAGYDDGLDHRQPPNIDVPEYSKKIEAENLKGMTIGILKEGFGHEVSEDIVDATVRTAATNLTKIGAKVVDVSIPLHKNSADIWTSFGFEGSYHCMSRGAGQGIGYKGYYPTNNMKISGAAMKHDTKHLSETVKYSMMLGAYMNEEFHGRYYGRGQNLARLLRKAYDDALEEYDVLIMPTTPFVAQKLPGTNLSFEDHVNITQGYRMQNTTAFGGTEHPTLSINTGVSGKLPIDHVKISQGMMQNTMAFNVTGHPALSINAGWSGKLPIGMMIVGRHWDDVTVLKVAHAHEKLMATK